MKKLSMFLPIVLMFMLRCSGAPADPAPDAPPKIPSIEEMALKALFPIIEEANNDKVKLACKADRIQVGNATVAVQVEEDFKGKDVQGYVYAANFITKLSDYETPFRFGVVGLGADERDAMRTAVEEWAALFGKAFARLLVDRSSAVPLGSDVFFEGPMGLRGDFPGNAGVFADSLFYQKLLTAAASTYPEAGGDIVTVDIRMMVDVKRGGEDQLMLAINGELLDQQLNAIVAMDWPRGKDPYMAKFYFILDRRGGD